MMKWEPLPQPSLTGFIFLSSRKQDIIEHKKLTGYIHTMHQEQLFKYSPLFSTPLLPGQLVSRIYKNVQEDRFKLFKNDCRDCKVSLQFVNFISKSFGQVSHI